MSIDSFDDNTMTRILSSLADWYFAKGFDAIFNRLGEVSDAASFSVCVMLGYTGDGTSYYGSV